MYFLLPFYDWPFKQFVYFAIYQKKHLYVGIFMDREKKIKNMAYDIFCEFCSLSDYLWVEEREEGMSRGEFNKMFVEAVSKAYFDLKSTIKEE